MLSRARGILQEELGRTRVRDLVELGFQAVEKLPPQVASELLRSLLKSRSWLARIRALAQLVRRGHAEYLDLLCDVLDDTGDPWERIEAARALVAEGDQRGFEALRQIVQRAAEGRDPDRLRGLWESWLDCLYPAWRRKAAERRFFEWGIKRAAGDALMSLGDPQGPRFFRAELQDPGSSYHEGAALSLAKAAYEEGTQKLEELLAHGNRHERPRAARFLGEVGARQSVPALVTALDDPEWVVRRAAARALGALQEESAARLLESLLSDPCEEVRIAAAGALAALGRQVGVEYLQAVASTSDNMLLRIRAVEALGEAATPSALARLRSMVDAMPPDVAQRALKALLDADDRGSLRIAIEVLTGRHPRVQMTQALRAEHILEAIGRIGDASVLDDVARFLEDPRPPVRCLAACAVVSLASDEAKG